MNYKAMQRLLRARPFHPFDLITSAGAVHPIKHPELAALAKTRVVVVDPETDDVSVLPLLHITEARFTSTAEA